MTGNGITHRQRAAIGKAVVATATEIYKKTHGIDLFSGSDDYFDACAAIVCDLAHYCALRMDDLEGGIKIIEDFWSVAREWYIEDIQEEEV